MIAIKRLVLTGAAMAALGACTPSASDQTGPSADTSETAAAPATDTGRVRGVEQAMTNDALTGTP